MKRLIAILVGTCGFLLWSGPGYAAKDIETAIREGVAYLRSVQDPNGGWSYEGEAGLTALVGLTLLEAGARTDDKAVQQAAQIMRRESVHMIHTYSLATTLLFLDRLGEPADVPLIESLGIRLLRGQNTSGGWTYSCPRLEKAEVRRLVAVLEPPGQPGLVLQPPAKQHLTRDAQMIANAIRDNSPPPASVTFGDNSNTQFAAMALWVVRRHGVAVRKAVNLVGQRFRSSQTPTGGWGYVTPSPTPAMTCAGLLGLAIATGSANEAAHKANFARFHRDPKLAKPKAMPDPLGDPAIAAGLIALESVIGSGPNLKPAFQPPQEDDFYFWWSVERVAVAYDLPTIGKVDWYTVGAQKVLRQQQQNGSWVSQKLQDARVDTCFALLFLLKANLARDLTFSLRGQMPEPTKISFQARGPATANEDKPASPDGKPSEAPGDAKPVGSVPIDLDLPDPLSKRNRPDRPQANANDLDQEVRRWSEQLVNASGNQVETVLTRLREGRGPQYSLALARSIPLLDGSAKTRARDALAERLARMTGVTLRTQMRDRDAELRRAAALACAMKEDKSHIPDLIPLVEDTDTPVTQAARAALKDLTGQDFGPTASASRAERTEALRRWKDWWNQQGGK
jgi:hypothetical protein